MTLIMSSGYTLGKDLREDKRCIEVVKHKDIEWYLCYIYVQYMRNQIIVHKANES